MPALPPINTTKILPFPTTFVLNRDTCLALMWVGTPPASLLSLLGALLVLRAFPSQAKLKSVAAGPLAWPHKEQWSQGRGRWVEWGRTHIMQLIVEATGIADRVPIGVSAP